MAGRLLLLLSVTAAPFGFLRTVAAFVFCKPFHFVTLPNPTQQTLARLDLWLKQTTWTRLSDLTMPLAQAVLLQSQ